MKLRLIAVGKLRERYIAAAVADFAQRLRPYAPFEQLEIPASFGGDPERAKRDEGERLLRVLVAGEPLWLLERTGTQLTSIEFAAKLRSMADAGATRLNFAIAGTYGASPEVLAKADFCWSLSSLTFLHEWARALAMEQLYRAAKIGRNEPYHH